VACWRTKAAISLKRVKIEGTASPGGAATTLGGGTAISGGRMQDTGCGIPFRLNLTTGALFLVPRKTTPVCGYRIMIGRMQVSLTSDSQRLWTLYPAKTSSWAATPRRSLAATSGTTCTTSNDILSSLYFKLLSLLPAHTAIIHALHTVLTKIQSNSFTNHNHKFNIR